MALSQPDFIGFPAFSLISAAKSAPKPSDVFGSEVSGETIGVETVGPASWIEPPVAVNPNAIATIAIVNTIAALSILTIIDPSLTIC